jgi:DNA-binding HxlR family transcriptional regulator
MSATVRYDQQYCPIARALDVLGDRWTLPIVRELLIGDQRFTDLRRQLPGIAPTVLTQRLRTMTEEGLVTTRDDPAGSKRSLYTLTDRGRSTVPVLRSLARWGMPLLEEPDDDLRVRPWTAVNTAVGIYYDPVAAVGIDERYRFLVDGEEITLSSVRGNTESETATEVTFESTARVWIDIRQGRLTLAEARRHGLLEVRGPKKAIANFRRIFQVD